MKKDVYVPMMQEENPEIDLYEECKKYGIDYQKPYFEPIMMLVGEDESAIPYFFLGTDIQKSDKLKNEINEFNKAFWYYRDNEHSINPFKETAAVIKYNRAVKKLMKVASAENIKLYSRDEMNKCINDYDNQIKQDIERVKSKKEEMCL